MNAPVFCKSLKHEVEHSARERVFLRKETGGMVLWTDPFLYGVY